MSARCDLSDLPVEMCACRVHGPREAHDGAVPVPVGESFPARYTGKCAGCGDGIRVDDPIRRLADGGGYVHEECA